MLVSCRRNSCRLHARLRVLLAPVVVDAAAHSSRLIQQKMLPQRPTSAGEVPLLRLRASAFGADDGRAVAGVPAGGRRLADDADGGGSRDDCRRGRCEKRSPDASDRGTAILPRLTLSKDVCMRLTAATCEGCRARVRRSSRGADHLQAEHARASAPRQGRGERAFRSQCMRSSVRKTWTESDVTGRIVQLESDLFLSSHITAHV